jgi:hypothetical protein
VDEGRKRTPAVIAAIFACRKLAALEGRPSPAREAAFSESISLAEELMRRIDRQWPFTNTTLPQLNISIVAASVCFVTGAQTEND